MEAVHAPARSLPAVLRSLYRKLRTAALNRDYNGHRLASVRRLAFWIDIAIAVGTSSAIGGLAFWSTPGLDVVWLAIGAVATVLSVAKPFLKLPDKIEGFSALQEGYASAVYDLDRIREEAEIHAGIDDALYGRYMAVLDRLKQLPPSPDATPNEALRAQCTAAVNRQYPTDSFWMPPA